MDLHVWLTTPSGEIIDWDFPEYEMVKRFRGLKGDKKYARYEKTKAAELLPSLLTLVRAKIETAEAAGIPRSKLEKLFYEHPQANDCMMNAYFYKKRHPQCKLVIGAMGWARRTPAPAGGDAGGKGPVFWEYGMA